VHRLSFIVSVLVLLLLLLPTAVATAQGATPAISPGADQPLDLAAMALTPDDIDLPGTGRWYAESLTFEQVVPGLAENGGKDPAAVREVLVAAGWQRQYHSTLSAPEVFGVATPIEALRINAYVHEFADAAGAAAAFTFLEDESGRPSPSSGATPVAGGVALAEDIPGTRVIGDESEITRHLGAQSGSSLPYRSLDLTFRLGNLVAGVEVADFTGGEPDVAEVEALAETYLERIEQVRAEGGPGLHTRTVRLEAPNIVSSRDDYLRLDSDYVPYYNESPETTAFNSTLFGDAIDLHFVSQSLPAGRAGSGDDVTYENYLTRFADEAAASDYLVGIEERMAGFGGYEVEAVPDAATVGDESRTFAIDRQAGDQETRGYEIYARVGTEVVDVLLFAQPEAPLEVVEELAAAQVACLQSEELCARMPVPAALAALAPPATPAAATPEAAPVASYPLDLGAMMLTPANLDAIGLIGFGRESQTYWELAEGTDPSTYGGLQRQYQSQLVATEPVDPGATSVLFRAIVLTTVGEYANAADAAAAFALVEADDPGGEGTPVPQEVVGTSTIGDQSTIRRHELVSTRGRPYLQLDLAFQRGNIVAQVVIAEYNGQELDLTTLEALGNTVLAKIDAVVAGEAPGLQPRTLRLVGQDLITTFDGYARLEGETLLGYNATAEDQADEAARLGDATDGYSVIQNLTRGTEDLLDDVYMNPTTFRFTTPEAASVWFREGPERLARDATYYLDVTPVDGAPTMGDESAAFSVTIDSGENRYTGYVYFVRIGRETAEIPMVRHEAQPAVPLEAAVELAAAQVGCLRSAATCAPLPVPADLVALGDVVSPMAATPVVATPVAATPVP
jgi:hypothetical protein